MMSFGNHVAKGFCPSPTRATLGVLPFVRSKSSKNRKKE